MLVLVLVLVLVLALRLMVIFMPLLPPFQIHQDGGEGVSMAKKASSLETTWRNSEDHLSALCLQPTALYSFLTGATSCISPSCPCEERRTFRSPVDHDGLTEGTSEPGQKNPKSVKTFHIQKPSQWNEEHIQLGTDLFGGFFFFLFTYF